MDREGRKVRSSIEALKKDIEATEAALKGANEAYAKDERALHDAQRKAGRSYEARAEISRNLDALMKALELIENGGEK